MRIILAFLISVFAASSSLALANQGNLPQSRPDVTAVAEPAPVRSDADVRLAEKYAAGLEATTAALERVIAAQSNQINVMTVLAAVFGLLLTVAGFGLFRSLRNTVREAVDDRVADLLSHRLDSINARSAKLHEVFLQTMSETAQNLVESRRSELLGKIRARQVDINTPEGISHLIKLQSDIMIIPMQAIAITFALAAGQDEPGKLREHTWVLFAEVSSGAIPPRTMLKLVIALINILHNRRAEPLAMSYLKQFAEQLRASIESGELPTEPAF